MKRKLEEAVHPVDIFGCKGLIGLNRTHFLGEADLFHFLGDGILVVDATSLVENEGCDLVLISGGVDCSEDHQQDQVRSHQ